ncbi:hypothetical protein ABZX62_32120 [Streptomyces flavidovirens]|uniref:hypothetical protein n=1 Tax=Streptomyces flavidovirens TaxID=67298 RepID=UPI0033AE453F
MPVRAPAAPSAVAGGVGEVGMEELPSGRGPAAVEGSVVVGVGAALDWVGMLAARLSIEVLIEPPLLVGEGVPLDAGVGADWGVGAVSPPVEEEPPRVSPVPGVLLLVLLLLVSGVGEGVGEGGVLLGAGSSKSDSVGLEGEFEEEGFCPASGVLLPVSVLGRLPRSGAL